MMKQCVMFTVSPVHTRDHDPRCSGADPEPVAGQIGGGSYIMPIQECNRRLGANALLGHLEALR